MIIERIGRVTTWTLAVTTLLVEYAVAEKQWIWDVSCKEKVYGTVYQYRVSSERVEERVDFGQWRGIPSSRFADLVVQGSDTSLFISAMGDSVHQPKTIHLVWWNHSNPSLHNSYLISPYWTQNGEVSFEPQFMNCVADSYPTENFRRRTGFVKHSEALFERRTLSGDIWQ